MSIPGGVSLFQMSAILFGIFGFWISLKSRNDAKAWNSCAPTLSVNHCPYQIPEQAFKCRNARRQMDSYIRSHVQNYNRKDPYQLYSLAMIGSTLLVSIIVYIIYYLIPFNGQLCLAKILNISAFASYTAAAVLIVIMVLNYNKLTGPYSGSVCSLDTTLPQLDFGDKILNVCFQDFHICQNAVLAFCGVALDCIAALFHLLAFISAVWDCHTQLDEHDWGTIDDLPDNLLNIRPEPPVYIIESEKEMEERKKREERRAKEERKKRVAYEKEREKEERIRANEEKRVQKEKAKQIEMEFAKREKYENQLKQEEKKKKKLEEKAKGQEERKRLKELEKKEREESLARRQERKRNKKNSGPPKNLDKTNKPPNKNPDPDKEKENSNDKKSATKLMENQVSPKPVPRSDSQGQDGNPISQEAQPVPHPDDPTEAQNPLVAQSGQPQPRHRHHRRHHGHHGTNDNNATPGKGSGGSHEENPNNDPNPNSTNNIDANNLNTTQGGDPNPDPLPSNEGQGAPETETGGNAPDTDGVQDNERKHRRHKRHKK